MVAIPLSLSPPGWCSTTRAHHQHDGAGRLRHLGRGGRRRRDHRRREHLATAAAGAARPASTTSTARIVLDASIEVRRAIVYATLINVAAIAAGVLPGGAVGRVLPTARHVVRTGAPGLDGRRADRDAGARPAPAAQARPRRGASPRSRSAAGPVVLRASCARLTSTARPAYFAVAGSRCSRSSGTPQLGQSLLPEFKERDFLMHWVTKPGTSLQEEVRITTLSAEGLGAIPGVRNFGAHIGQASNADEVVGPEFGENWISIDPEADYDETSRRSDGGRRVPGPLPRRADLPEGADPGGAHRDGRGDRRANLR